VEERHFEFLPPIPTDMQELMANFYIYADESGKLASSDIVSFCGYVSHATECNRTSLEWNNCRLKWGIPTVHMRYIVNPDRDKSGQWQKIKSEWGNLWERRRDEMLNSFGAVLLNSNMVAVGASVDAKHFREVMPDTEWKRKMHDPIFLALWHLLRDALEKIDRFDKTLSVGIILDDDPEHAKEYYDLLGRLKNLFPNMNRISAITFGNDDAYPALQMADVIAFESRRLMVERMKDSNVPPSDLYIALTSRGLHQPKMWTAEFLDRAAELGVEDGAKK
jgi:Protein of unknown function (DUF3800)